MTDSEKALVLDALVNRAVILSAKPLKILSVDEDFLRTRKGFGIESKVTNVSIDMKVNFDMELDADKYKLVMSYLEEQKMSFHRPDLSPTVPPKKVALEWPLFEELPVDGCLP